MPEAVGNTGKYPRITSKERLLFFRLYVPYPEIQVRIERVFVLGPIEDGLCVGEHKRCGESTGMRNLHEGTFCFKARGEGSTILSAGTLPCNCDVC